MKNTSTVKLFLIKFLIFSAPFIILSVNYLLFYESSGGDLNRISRISIDKKYRDMFKEDFIKPKKYRNLSDINLNRENKIDIIAIGDSFLQDKKNYSFSNYLSSLYNLDVVNMYYKDFHNSALTPIQLLSSMVNGDLFNKLKVDYVVLEAVEREIVNYGIIDRIRTTTIKDLDSVSDRMKPVEESQHSPLDLGICHDILIFFINNILYSFDDRAYIERSYKVKLTKDLFSTKENELLFYHEDIDNIKYSTIEGVRVLNNELNIISRKLKDKGVKLIVLPAPDKYDLYCSFIKNNKLPNNDFFNLMKKERKEYIYVNTKEILLEHLSKGEKDIYFADDSHWSPITSKIIATKVYTEL